MAEVRTMNRQSPTLATKTRPKWPARLVALLVSFLAGVTTLVTGAGAAQAQTGDFHISHVYVNVSEPWANPGRISSDWGIFLQSFRNAVGVQHDGWGDTLVTQSGSLSLVRADLNIVNAAGHQVSLRLWFTPDNMYLRGFTTTAVDANNEADGNVTYYFNDYDLPGRFHSLRGSPDAGLLPPDNDRFILLPYSGGYYDLERSPQSGGPGAERSTVEMSYTQVYNSIFQLAYLPYNTARNGGSNYRTTAASLLRMIQVVPEAARLRDVQGIVIQMMANHGYQFTMPARQQDLENDWSALSQYALNNVNTTHQVGNGQSVPTVTTVARALGYLAVAKHA
ncbi:ribosome-inactivating family protein [Streptomyces rubradiris]|uniref:ribosome-inactivating family protein n=1 Tax=Streptomyces rubradiris TaxID=285531 RepID=UPI0036ED96B9